MPTTGGQNPKDLLDKSQTNSVPIKEPVDSKGKAVDNESGSKRQ